MSLKSRICFVWAALSLVSIGQGCATVLRGTAVTKKIKIQSLSQKQEPAQAEIITIWVHGTRMNPLFSKLHTSPKGLLSLAELTPDYRLKGLAETLDAHDSSEFHRERFYAFGWSGDLSFAAREKAGVDLNEAIRQVHAKHKTLNRKSARIRLVTHSHGCNVALNAAESLASGEPMLIDELVLMACPVQDATSKYLRSSVFRKIFALYSDMDLLQVLDPQGLYGANTSGSPLFSGRTFEAQPNLVQAQVRWNGFGLTHIGFVRKRFGGALPNILQSLRTAHEDPENPPENTHYVIDLI